MRTRFLTAVFAVALATTAMAAPKPVITVQGVVSATHATPAVASAIAEKVVALNLQLEKYRDRNPDTDIKAIHEQCKALHDAIAAQLDPQQQHEFMLYLHAQMEAAGVDFTQFHAHEAHHQ